MELMRQLENLALSEIETFAQYLVLTERLDPTTKDKFLLGLPIITNLDPDGITNRIDPGMETIMAAQFLADLETPNTSIRSITSRNISDYLTDYWSRSVQGVEAAVWAMIGRILKNPDDPVVNFLGKKYISGKDRLNWIINDVLETSGSNYRIFIGHSESPSGLQTYLFFGHALDEKKVEINGQSIRIVSVGELKVDLTPPYTSAVSDCYSTIMILERDARAILQARDNVNFFYSNYLHLPHVEKLRAVYNDYLASGASENQRNFQILIEGLVSHELGHFRIIEQFGSLFNTLKISFATKGENTLKTLDEFFANLYIIDEILTIAERDAHVAGELFQVHVVAWSGPQDPVRGFDAAPFRARDLLLSAVRLTKEGYEIDWKVLKEKARSIRVLLSEIFSSLTAQIKREEMRKIQNRVDRWFQRELGSDPLFGER